MNNCDPAFKGLDEINNKILQAQQNETCCEVEMPRYQCHKKVWALKIEDIKDPTQPGNESDGSRIIVPAEQGYAPFRVDHNYVRKHNPQVGGYFVVYEDGYKSFSPAEAFESGYSRL